MTNCGPPHHLPRLVPARAAGIAAASAHGVLLLMACCRGGLVKPDAAGSLRAWDGAKGWHHFRTIIFPLLAPTTFFLLVVNTVYAAFDTFGTIYALTRGGPGKATETLMIKVYRGGVVNLDLGSSSAQSVVLMAGIITLTVIQFRFIGRRSNA
jgi:ABC-type sugar transport system permease subunit